MATRGMIGFICGGGSDMLPIGIYACCDARPFSLGVDFYNLCKELIPEDTTDLIDYMEKLPSSDEGYDASEPIEYARNLLTKKAVCYHEDIGFVDEQFCRYAYILDLDNCEFTFYKSGTRLGSINLDSNIDITKIWS